MIGRSRSLVRAAAFAALATLVAALCGCPGGGGQAAAPVLTPGAGTYTSGQTVSLWSETPGCTLWYTTDGSAPGPGSLLYLEPIRVADDTCTGQTCTFTIRAVAVCDDMADSPEATGTYIIEYPYLYVSGNLNGTPVYWKDDEIRELPKGSSSYVETRGIAVSSAGLVLAVGAGDAGTSYTQPVHWDQTGHHALTTGGAAGGEALSVRLGPTGGLLVAGSVVGGVYLDSFAAAWVDGQITVLTRFGYDSAFAGGIARTSEGRLIVSGTVTLDTWPGTTNYACIWDDGSLQVLDGAEGTPATSLWVSEADDIYVTGFGGYWKNGVHSALSGGGSGYAVCAGIVTHEDSVLVCGGGWGDGSSSVSVPVCWIDGAMSLLSTGGATNGMAISVAAHGNDVYIAGEVWNSDWVKSPVYWKNGTLNYLPRPDGTSGSIHPYEIWAIYGATTVLALVPQ